MSQAILEISGLTRRFGALRAVDGVDLRIEDGAITGLIGRMVPARAHSLA